MHVTLTTARERVPVTPQQWNALAAKSATNTVFQTYEWFDSWWDAYGADRELFLVTVHDAGDLLGILPMIRARGPLGLSQLEFASSRNADYQDLLVATGHRDDAIRAVCGFLHRERSQWDMIVLRNLPTDSPTLPAMRKALVALAMPTMEVEHVPCPTLLIRGREAEVRSLIDRYSVRRRVRGLEQQGPVSFQLLRGAEDIGACLPTLYAQHQRRWGERSQFHDPRSCDFYRRLALALDPQGWLHLSAVRCGSRIVACHLGFRYGGRLYWYKSSFDVDFARHSPGTVLLRHLILDALDQGLEELDFTVGEEPFKQRFTNARRMNVNLRVFHSPPMHAAVLAVARARAAARSVYHRMRRAGKDFGRPPNPAH